MPEKDRPWPLKKNVENDIHSRWIAGSSPLVPPDPCQNAAGAPSPQDPVGESLLSPPRVGDYNTHQTGNTDEGSAQQCR